MRLFCAHKNQKSGIQIRTIMVENIEKILERGDRIELLVDKTATMQDSAFHFKKQSKRLRRALWMKNAKLLWVLPVLSYHFGFMNTLMLGECYELESYQLLVKIYHPRVEKKMKRRLMAFFGGWGWGWGWGVY